MLNVAREASKKKFDEAKFAKNKCKLSEAEFEHQKRIFENQKKVEEFEKASSEFQKSQNKTPEQREKIKSLLPYKPVPLKKLQDLMAQSGINHEDYIKPLEDESTYEIKLKLESLENKQDKSPLCWIQFYEKMRQCQLPSEIVAVEITGIDPNFIKNERRKYLEKEEEKGLKILTTEQYINEILHIIPARGLQEFRFTIPKTNFDFNKIKYQQITNYCIKKNLEVLQFGNINFVTNPEFARDLYAKMKTACKDGLLNSLRFHNCTMNWTDFPTEFTESESRLEITLSFPQCNIKQVGPIIEVAKRIPINLHLNLSQNDLDEDAMKQIHTEIKNNQLPKLKMLGLSNNDVDQSQYTELFKDLVDENKVEIY